MTRDEALARLHAGRAALETLPISSLSVFGSVSRNEAGPESDIDLLVEFSEPVGLLTMARLQRLLEDMLGGRVDLVTPAGLRPEMRARILEEAVRAA
jgi:predicted nucleotidyltransferase